ncbi:RnfABCDGE type electron transport complex subunit D [Wenxinia marina]|uniref:Na+-transporting NADH:ubiquinone oxidoreductase, subunit NqrB n=1 Tax=Wenxinia marina DSM 24838 TaxID=1123501 RepID=A0A0D0PIP4_9RHOB|nr:RnfABCDGE type electron transport complex subunit D [Wenxinia marina]KIQ71216.1 Na+-transporting NADH:ubiquinone oxidoreductase, subunit NqrB [Wenxinia marina DSM 24838]GGL81552.1 hypothetical protein GCM10011392_40220 [Wenxinia marina]
MIRGLWDRETVASLLVAAHLPLALFWLWYGGAEAVATVLLAALVLAGWHLVFLLARAQPPSLSGIVTALAVAVLVPQDLGAVRLVLGISFGAVMGELVFGGWGRNVVNPATVALSFLGFGFPAAPWPHVMEPVAWAALATGVLGIAAGIMPAGVFLGAALLAGVAGAAGALPAEELLAGGLVLVLLLGDPVTAAGTALGRWLHGGLYGGLLTLFALGWEGGAPVQMAVAAALLASLAAPLLDEMAITLWLARRRRRHGGT